MNSNFLHQRGIQALLGFMLVFGFIFAAPMDAGAQNNKPNVPVLSLTGDEDDYNENWYPDGLIRMVPSDNVDTYNEAKLRGKEFLLPVFIDNKWTKYPGVNDDPVDGVSGNIKGDMYVPDDIHSFEFKLQYDSSVMRPIGIQKFHPYEDEDDQRFQTMSGDYYEPLAKDFNVEWHDYADTSYRWLLFGDETANLTDKKRGRTIKINGTSTSPLPHTNLATSDFRILFYVKFRVVTTGGGATPRPVYISNDTIKYNDMNVCMDCPFIEYRGLPGYDVSIFDTDYSDPNPADNPRLFTNNRGLAGLSNYSVYAPYDTDQQSVYCQDNSIYYRPGVIWIKFSGVSPNINFYVPDAFISYPVTADPDYPERVTMIDPITMDYNNIPYATRNMFVQNSVDDSRLMDIEIESDQKWLQFKTVQGPNNQNPIRTPVRKGRINMIDKGILGPHDENDPVDRDTEDDGDVELQIICNPYQLEDFEETDEPCGIYVGHLTFKSKYADVSPIRLKITFIYFKVPDEWLDPTGNPGMEIIVKTASGLSNNLIFGSGDRATKCIDTLYGESAQTSPMDEEFEARWFPPDGWVPCDENDEPDNTRLRTFGYNDWAPDAWNPRSNSRDIRNIEDNEQSLVYFCKFTMGDMEAQYPITVEWDIQQFPEGSQLFLRDVLNGTYFNVDMNNGGTALEGTRRSYTIEDANFRSFIIEYTPARTIEYVDEWGNPKIKKGWNLLSLPVRPVNTDWEVVYPNAINRPYFYSQAQYQDANDLKPGVGYFVKYFDQVDKIFAGSYFTEISRLTGIPVKLYSGWNTIGALSVLSSVYDIEFEQFEDAPVPTKSYTKYYGVWGYTTNKGYDEVTALEPGLGYWIKVGIENDPISNDKAVGYLRLTASENKVFANALPNGRDEVYETSTVINVRDNAQHHGQVYLTGNDNVELTQFELPPTPPTGLFDIRFNNNGIVDNAEESVIRLQGVTYPLAISVANSDANYTFMDEMTGEVLGMVNKGETKNIEVRGLSNNRIKVVKTDGLAGVSVYPNPAQYDTNVEFNVEENSLVTIKIYDLVGNEIKSRVVDATAGLNTVQFNVSAFSAGTYICKMISATNTTVATFNVVK